MQFSFIFSVIVAFASSIPRSSALNILGITTTPSPSHHIWFSTLMNGLGRRGHQLYTLGIKPVEFDKEILRENRTESFVLEGFLEKFQKEQNSDLISEWMRFDAFDAISFFYTGWDNLCKEQMETDVAKALLKFVKNTRIDAIVYDVTFGQCFYSLLEVAKGNPTFVAYTPFGAPAYVKNFVGGNHWPAIIHHHGFVALPPFTLWEKTMNVIYHEYDDFVRNKYYLPAEQTFGEDFVGKKMSTSFSEMEKKASVFLTNTHPSFDSASFLPPNVVEVGGLHIREPKPLPEDIKKFLDGAEHGAIVISMGSNIKSSVLGPRRLKAVLSALSQLKQRVVWKFDADDLPNKPSNVMIKEWLPQSDILTHPKIRVLWTHSGLLSTHEALWWGIPVIGMPFFMDQFVNIGRLVKSGAGLRLDFETLSTESILQTVNKILDDPSFARRMKQLSEEFRDRPMSPLDLAVWHVEHSARHPGVLSSPGKHLSRWELNLLDVYALLGTIFLLILGISWYLVRTVLGLFRGQQKVKTS